ncbi:S8 family serine peptidase [bacterium]|nr:S8 family serine peptidase [bacterium]
MGKTGFDRAGLKALALLIVLALLTLATASCGGKSLIRSLADSVEDTVRLTADEAGALPLPMPTPENNFRTDGLTPGEDYYPDRFVVSFKQGAKGSSVAPQVKDYNADSVLYQNTEIIPLARQIRDAFGLEIYGEAYCGDINFAAFKIPDGSDARPVMEQVLADYSGQVACVEYDGIAYPSAYTPDDPYFKAGVLWGMTKINADDAWDYEKGDPNVLVAVIDTGIRYSGNTLSDRPNHPDLAANTIHPPDLWPAENFDIHENDKIPNDTASHGSHVSGTIAAVGNNNAGVVGVAYQCSIVPIRVFGAYGGCPVTEVVEAIGLAVDGVGADVINMSLGSSSNVWVLENACNYAEAHGAFLVAAAGNDDVTTKEYPGAYDSVVCVGATKKNDDRASYSNYGTWVDVAAPGGEHPPDENMIASCGHQPAFPYVYMQGTSMATPHVAGAAALLKSYAPTLTNAEIKAALVNSGPVLPSGQWGNNDLHRLDVYEALSTVLKPTVSFPMPSPLVATDTLVIEPELVENADRVDYYVDGEPWGTFTEAPWGIEVDTSGIEYGNVEVTVIATRDSPHLIVQQDLTYIVDNSGGIFPKTYLFESESDVLASWTSDPGGAFERLSTGFESSYSFGVHSYEPPDYPAGLTAITVLPLLNLPAGPPNPTLTLRMRYNLENGADIGRVFLSTDNFDTDWNELDLRSGDDAVFTGYEPDYVSKHVSISDWAGQSVHIGFMLETNDYGVGEDTGQPAGWWLDQIIVATMWAESVPLITETGLEDPARVGTVIEVPQLSFSAGTINDAVTLEYNLYTTDGTVSGELEGPPFEDNIDISSLPNQVATLDLQAFDDRGVCSPVLEVPVWVYNLIGDVDGDGSVGESDRDSLIGLLGLTPGSPLYRPWYDTNANGAVDEADLAAIGYFWGSSM